MPQTPLGELTAPTESLAGFRGKGLREGNENGRGDRGRERKGMESGMERLAQGCSGVDALVLRETYALNRLSSLYPSKT